MEVLLLGKVTVLKPNNFERLASKELVYCKNNKDRFWTISYN